LEKPEIRYELRCVSGCRETVRACKHEPTPIKYGGLRRAGKNDRKVCPCRPGDEDFFRRGRFIYPTFQEDTMNKDRVEGNWLQFKGKVKEQWGKLTDDDLDVIAGKRDQLLGRIQERHGLSKDEAEKQVNAWKDRNPTDFFERY
jgi:uncharacterized protein YjbJ (UPF0337 family)